MKVGKVHWKPVDWEEVEREYVETLGPPIDDANLKKMKDDTLEPLRECMHHLARRGDLLLSRG